MKTLKLTFNTDGTVTKETSGFSGKNCAKETAWVETALGTPEKLTWKPEAAKAETTKTQATTGA